MKIISAGKFLKFILHFLQFNCRPMTGSHLHKVSEFSGIVLKANLENKLNY